MRVSLDLAARNARSRGDLDDVPSIELILVVHHPLWRMHLTTMNGFFSVPGLLRQVLRTPYQP